MRLLPVPDGGDEANRVGVVLEVRLGSAYPQDSPELQVRPIKGITNKEATELLGRVRAEAERSCGAPMVFTLTSVCKEWLDLRNEGEAAPREELNPLAATEALHLAGDGTPVTPENYALWWAAFLREKQPLVGAQTEGRLTGRQIFIQRTTPGLVAPPKRDEGEEGDDPAAVDWALFADEEEEEVPVDEDEMDEEEDEVAFLTIEAQGPPREED